jgi:F0F1-type ATP synthase assembly protein I
VSAQNRKRDPILTVIVVTPLVLTPFVLLGVYLGFYLGGLTGASKTILAIVFSLVGLVASMAILVRMITTIAKSS